MANPFRFGQVVSGDLLCNRESEIREITRDLTGGQSIVLYSPRRYGKTSLLQAVSKKIKPGKILYGDADFLPAILQRKCFRQCPVLRQRPLLMILKV